ncbi:MAG TPA: hypothetical protein PK957_01555 [Candidatus Dojkabacteria bacterium]|nr:hypothetical protein [Candidatus Dojkabacteria bacterium]HQF36361.1 hypothetical protein [Candidatus Dojkabacteria bacterium]
MENVVNVNAVQLRQAMGELLNRVYYQGITVHIKRRGKVIAKIVPADSITNNNVSPTPSNGVKVAQNAPTGSSPTFSTDELRKIQQDLLNNRL